MNCLTKQRRLDSLQLQHAIDLRKEPRTHRRLIALLSTSDETPFIGSMLLRGVVVVMLLLPVKLPPEA